MLIFLTHVSTLVYAAEEAVVEEPAPDFIEFLGEWETTEGVWVDPNELGTDAYTQAITELEQEKAGEQNDD